MWSRKRILVGAIAVILLAVVSGLYYSYYSVPPKRTLDKMVLVFPIPGYAESTGYYVASDQGFFEKEGLSVEIVSGQGGPAALQQVASGTATIGIADISTGMILNSQGAKLKLVGLVWRTAPHVYFTRAEDNIRTPKDLEGKRVGTTAGQDAMQINFRTVARINNVDLSKINWVTITAGARSSALFAKQVDASPNFVNQIATYENVGKVNVLKFKDWGLDLFGNGHWVTEETARQKPDLVRRFLRAAYQAVVWESQRIPEAAAISVKLHPELNKAIVESQTRIFVQESFGDRLLQEAATQPLKLGYIDPVKMQKTWELARQDYNVTVPVKDIYTNDFTVAPTAQSIYGNIPDVIASAPTISAELQRFSLRFVRQT